MDGSRAINAGVPSSAGNLIASLAEKPNPASVVALELVLAAYHLRGILFSLWGYIMTNERAAPAFALE